MAETYASEATFVKVNVDHNQNAAVKFQVAAIPTFYVFKNGEAKGHVIGANMKKVEALVKKVLEDS